MTFVSPETEETSFIPLTHGCLVFPALFIEEVVFSSVYLFVVCSFVENLVSVCKRDWFWVFDSAPWFACVLLCQHDAVSVTVALWYNLKSDIMMHLALFFLLNCLFTIWSLLCSHMNFRAFYFHYFCSVRNAFGILMRISTLLGHEY